MPDKSIVFIEDRADITKRGFRKLNRLVNRVIKFDIVKIEFIEEKPYNFWKVTFKNGSHVRFYDCKAQCIGCLNYQFCELGLGEEKLE